jgi:hypothetical protein
MNTERMIRKSRFKTMREDLLASFGDEAGASIYASTLVNLQELVEASDDRGVGAIRSHLNENILPAVAAYRAMLGAGIEQERAQAFIGGQIEGAAARFAKLYARLARLPFIYALLRRLFPSILGRMLPKEGWTMQTGQYDNRCLAFDVSRCFYVQTTKELGCFELCHVFCTFDSVSFAGLAPRVRFERTQTLANGDERCDFRFFNGNPPDSKTA